MEEGSTRKGTGILYSIARFFTGRRRVTEEELHELMEASQEEGIINGEEGEMIRAIFTLGESVVREVMVPRTDMACVTAEATAEEVLATIINCGHSRIPLYEGTIDNIIGVIYAKDLLKYWGATGSSLNLRAIARQPFYIPETKNLEELLQEFRRRRVHLAIVIDEYGGTSGLITIEDLLEQIVGDIQDEYDTEEELLQLQEDGSVLVDAMLPIEDFEEYFQIHVEREKFDTVGGLVFYLLGRIPAAGEEVVCSGIRLTVISTVERRIGKLLALRVIEPDSETVQEL